MLYSAVDHTEIGRAVAHCSDEGREASAWNEDGGGPRVLGVSDADVVGQVCYFDTVPFGSAAVGRLEPGAIGRRVSGLRLSVNGYAFRSSCSLLASLRIRGVS